MQFWYLPGRIVLARMKPLDRMIMRIMRAKDFDRTDRSALAPLISFLSD